MYHRYVGTLPITPGRLALADAFGELRTLSISRRVRELSNGAQVLDVVISGACSFYGLTFAAGLTLFARRMPCCSLAQLNTRRMIDR